MRFTVPLLAVLSIAGAVRSADPGAEGPGTLAQEYQKALKESGQISLDGGRRDGIHIRPARYRELISPPEWPMR